MGTHETKYGSGRHVVEMLEAAAGESGIVAAVVSHTAWDGDHEEALPSPWSDAKALIEQIGDMWNHYNSQVYAWTETHVLFLSDYDGQVGAVAVPRNPRPCVVEHIGG